MSVNVKVSMAVFLLVSVFGAAQVVVPVEVKDASGVVVHGLQASDFALSCRKVAAVEKVEEVAPARLDGFADPTPIFIVYDAGSLDEAVQQKMASMLLHFLREEAAQHHAVTLLRNTKDGLQLINNASTSPEVVLAALDRVAPAKNSGAETSAKAVDPGFAKQVDDEILRLQQLTQVVLRTGLSRTPSRAGLSPGDSPLQERMASLESVARSLQRSRERKLLLWLTGYFPIIVNDDNIVGSSAQSQVLDPHSNGNRGCRGEAECGEARFANYGLEITPFAWGTMVKTLNDSRISVYTTYITHSAHDITDCCFQVDPIWPNSGIENLAKNTAGRYIKSGSSLEDLVSELRREAAPYYILSLDTRASNNQWVPCTIKVDKEKVKVEAPNGFFAVK